MAMQKTKGNGRVKTKSRIASDEPTPGGRAVKIMPIQTARMDLIVEGLSELVVHRFSEKAKKAILDKQTKQAKQVRQARDPKAEFEGSLYPIPGKKGAYGFPASGFALSAIGAAAHIEGIFKTTARASFSVLGTDGDLIMIEQPGGKVVKGVWKPGKPSKPSMREDFVRIPPRTGSMSPCWRGSFAAPWIARVPVLVTDVNLLSPDEIATLFQHAGYKVGVGEGRKESTGAQGWGLFRVIDAFTPRDA